MPVEKVSAWDTRYLSVIGGKLAQKVEEGSEWAVKREYEIDGNKWVKYEVYYKNLSGYITWMNFVESPYGEMFKIVVEQDWEIDILTLNSDSRYFTDFARKLPWLDFAKPITMNPYDFESKGKQVRGLDLRQEWEKMTDAYYDWETKKSLKWKPEVNQDELKE